MSLSKYPRLHPKLENFSIFYSFTQLIENEECAIKFFEEISLIPSKDSVPPLCCNVPMKVETDITKKLRWRWRCSASSGKKKKGIKLAEKLLIRAVEHFLKMRCVNFP